MRLPKLADFPSGDLRVVYLHWTAAGYDDVFAAYHYCIALGEDGRARVLETHDLRANMRDVRSGGPYAAHTQGRNSFAAGIALCAMRGATPYDFGAAPLCEEQVEVACALAAQLCATYGLALEAVRTHAEAALDDGYFGCGDDRRWDIARLQPAAASLTAEETRITGDVLRARVAASLGA